VRYPYKKKREKGKFLSNNVSFFLNQFFLILKKWHIFHEKIKIYTEKNHF
jgi:hypothetical protein